METATCSMGELLASLCGGALEGGNQMCRQPALRVLPGTLPSVPAATGTIPPDGCVLGIDVGSTSTDLVLTGRDGTLIDYQYLRTACLLYTSLLLPVDDVRFGEDRAAAGEPGDGAGLPHQAGVVLQF